VQGACQCLCLDVLASCSCCMCGDGVCVRGGRGAVYNSAGGLPPRWLDVPTAPPGPGPGPATGGGCGLLLRRCNRLDTMSCRGCSGLGLPPALCLMHLVAIAASWGVH
jgi:hypothetical protein